MYSFFNFVFSVLHFLFSSLNGDLQIGFLKFLSHSCRKLFRKFIFYMRNGVGHIVYPTWTNGVRGLRGDRRGVDLWRPLRAPAPLLPPSPALNMETVAQRYKLRAKAAQPLLQVYRLVRR